MLPTTEHMEASTTTHGVGALLTGDLGVIVVRALLENGVGYVVSSWRDRPTPIDAAIDDARERLLVPRGVVLRRLRSLSAIEPIITAPAGGITGSPPRGAIVFAGRRGLRPVLEQFLAVRSSGAVVGFTFDDDALRIENALVIDPEPTAIGLVRAIDAAFEASVEARRPALVLLRERSLGMRGTIRLRDDRSPNDAADADAQHRTRFGARPAAAAAEQAALIVTELGADHSAEVTHAMLVAGPLRQGMVRALAQVSSALQPSTIAAFVDGIALVSARAIGVVPDAGGAAAKVLAAATDVCIVAPRAQRLADRLREAGFEATLNPHAIDPGTVRGEELVAIVLEWVRAHARTLGDDTDSLLDAAAARIANSRSGDTVMRVPRRSDQLHRAVSPIVAAGLALAQGVVGVPARLDAEYPTYRTDTGVSLTVVPGGVFALHGVASAAPGSGAGVFLVTDPAGGIAESANAAGASIEHVDGGSPRAIGAAIGRACRSQRTASHVIVVTELQRVAAPRSSVFGMDPDLVGTERIASAVVPVTSTALVELGDELLAGPTKIALDTPGTHAVIDQLRELTPATWDLRSASAGAGRIANLRWNLRRRLLRAGAGVDL